MTRRRDTGIDGPPDRPGRAAAAAGLSWPAVRRRGGAGPQRLRHRRGPAVHRRHVGLQRVTVAIVSTSQMQDAISLSYLFEREHPGIHLSFVSLPENEARAKTTAHVSTQGGEFDVVMISNYETPMRSANGWLCQPAAVHRPAPRATTRTTSCPSSGRRCRTKGDLYSVPFYGELSCSRRTARTCWPKRASRCRAGPRPGRRWKKSPPRCITPRRGWRGSACAGTRVGRNLAPIDTVINSFGCCWFNPAWQAQLTTPEVEHAVTKLRVRSCRSTVSRARRTWGSPSAPRCTARATRPCGTTPSSAARAAIEDPQASKVAEQERIRLAARSQDGRPSGWLYTWSLAIPATSPNKQNAWDFVAWMTSKSYIHTVGSKLGWSRVCSGSRFSSYQIPQYKKMSAVYGPLTLQSMNATNSAAPVRQAGAQHRCPVPGYPGVPGPGHQRQRAAQRGHRRPAVGGVRTVPGPAVRPGRRRQLPATPDGRSAPT